MTKFKLRELLQMLMLLPMLASVKGMHLNPQLAQGSSAHTPTFWSKWHDPSLRTFIKQPQVYTQKFVQPATPSTVSSRSSLASSPPTTPPSSLRQVQVKAVPAQRYSYNQAQPAYTAHPSQFYVNQHAPTQQLTAAPAPVRTAVSGPPSPRSQPMIQVRSQGLTSPRSLVCRSQAQTGPAALQPRGVVALAPVPLPKAVRFHEQNIQTREVAKPRTIQPAAPTQAHNFADDRDYNKRNQFQHLDENDSPIGSTKYIPNKTEKRTLAFETSASRDCQCAQKGKTEIQADIKLQMVKGYWTGPDGEQGWKLFDAAKSGKYDWMGVDKDGWWVRIGVLEGVADPQKERPESLGWRYVKEPTQMEIQLVYAGEVADECISGCCFARLSALLNTTTKCIWIAWLTSTDQKKEILPAEQSSWSTVSDPESQNWCRPVMIKAYTTASTPNSTSSLERVWQMQR